jgi:hypothetical protein
MNTVPRPWPKSPCTVAGLMESELVTPSFKRARTFSRSIVPVIRNSSTLVRKVSSYVFMVVVYFIILQETLGGCQRNFGFDNLDSSQDEIDFF